MRKILIPMLFAAAASGCATRMPPPAGDMRGEALPTVSLSNDWRVAEFDGGAIQDDWLAGFGDEALSALVQEALTNSPDLRAAAARVERAAGYVGLAQSALRPSLGLFGTGGFNLGGGDLSSGLLGAVLAASWELDLWGEARYGKRASESDYASQEAEFEFARQSLAGNVARSWFTATETLLQRNLAEEMTGLADEMVDIATKRHQVGAGNEFDAVLAKANASELRDILQSAVLAHEDALRALETLIGRYPAAEVAARSDLPPMPGPIPVGMPLGMLDRRPDLIAATRRVESAFYRVGQAKASLLPKISLNASGSYLDSDILQLKDDYDNPSGGLGAKAAIPIYQGGALTSQVAIRTAEQREAVAEYGRIALRAISDVEKALAASRSLEEREQNLIETATNHEKALELAQVAYSVGTQDMRAVLQQQFAVHRARLALLSVRAQKLTQRVNLHLALGGSFEAPPPPPPADEEPLDGTIPAN